MAADLEYSAANGSIWSELPQHLVETLLARLPLDCIFRFRSVCKCWNDALSCKHFGSLWAESGGGQPCLILCMPKTRMGFLLYSFSSRAWQAVSLSFMPDVRGVSYRGSAAGLLLVDIPIYPITFGSSFSRICVCNPLRRTCFPLPPMLTVMSSVMAKTIVAGDDPATYEVLVVGKTRHDAVIAQIYTSSTKSWKLRYSFPHGLVIRNDEMFVCSGFLFCLTVPEGIMTYDVREGMSLTIDVPDSRPNIWHRLVACASSILIVGGIEENHVLKEVMMWELLHKDGFDGHGFSWKEMGRMPESACQQFRKDSMSTWFECVGVGDKICFRAHGSLQVVVYSVTHRSWSWLPSCPDPHQDRKNLHLRSLSFQPSLDNYKV